jgi:hypothetical protein
MSKALGASPLKKIMLGAQRLRKIMLGDSELFPRFIGGPDLGAPVPIDSWTTAGTGAAAGIGFDSFSNYAGGGFIGINTTTGGNRMALSTPTFTLVNGQVYNYEVDIVSTNIAGNFSLGQGTNVRSTSVNFAAGASGTLSGQLTVNSASGLTGCSFRVLASVIGQIEVSQARLWLSPIALLPGGEE